jgi:uncharacterized RDD family membrane protein YckC
VPLAEVRRHGGFWIRLGAGIIDGLLLSVPLVILESRLGPGIRLLGLVTWLYFPLLESSAGQATIGKLVCGLRVTDTYGRPISFGRACEWSASRLARRAAVDGPYRSTPELPARAGVTRAAEVV